MVVSDYHKHLIPTEQFSLHIGLHQKINPGENYVSHITYPQQKDWVSLKMQQKKNWTDPTNRIRKTQKEARIPINLDT